MVSFFSKESTKASGAHQDKWCAHFVIPRNPVSRQQLALIGCRQLGILIDGLRRPISLGRRRSFEKTFISIYFSPSPSSLHLPRSGLTVRFLFSFFKLNFISNGRRQRSRSASSIKWCSLDQPYFLLNFLQEHSLRYPNCCLLKIAFLGLGSSAQESDVGKGKSLLRKSSKLTTF